MNDYMNIKAVYDIARQEFVRTLTHPLILIAAVIVLILAYLNGAGGASDLEFAAAHYTEDALISGFVQSAGVGAMICTIVAVFLGAIMIPSERWNNSLNVLLTKPLYRRDYFIGKFMGLSGFMLLFNAFTILLFGLMTIAFFRGPQSGLEFTWRAAAYIIISTLACSLVIALNMLFGVILKNLLSVTAASLTYFFFEWIWYNDRMLGFLYVLTPVNLCRMILIPFFNPFSAWFYAALPYLAILFVEMFVFLLAGVYLFSREDGV